MRAKFIPVFVLGLFLGSAVADAPQKLTFPAQILLIRHAEKPADGVDLSDAGKQRAAALAGLFKKTDARPNPFPTPDFIFAASNSKHSHRSLETVTPLAKSLNLHIDDKYPDDDFAQLADHILHKSKYEGKVVLICWHHGKLPELAHALKAADAPDHFKGSEFDRVWQITYDNQGKATFVNRPQRLLPGDAPE